MGTASRNFDWSEFRCRCGVCGLQSVDQLLVVALEGARRTVGAYFGGADVGCVVESGVRCASWNERVGGTTGSWHVPRASTAAGHPVGKVGYAADVRFTRGVQRDWVLALSGFDMTRKMGFGIYPGRGIIHLDVRGSFARWGKVGSGYVSWVEAVRRL